MQRALLGGALSLALHVGAAAAQPPDPGSAYIENRQLALLAEVEDHELRPYTSDGCSGGLSTGWNWLAQHDKRYAALFGARPPWEACCVIHDWTYWSGGSAEGYARRLAADSELHRCVVASGERQAEDIGRHLHLPPAAVNRSFTLAADLMFVAVRVGGAPCTPLPWRWGYGRPACAPLLPERRP
jgi:hypothetical protein